MVSTLNIEQMIENNIKNEVHDLQVATNKPKQIASSSKPMKKYL